MILLGSVTNETLGHLWTASRSRKKDATLESAAGGSKFLRLGFHSLASN